MPSTITSVATPAPTDPLFHEYTDKSGIYNLQVRIHSLRGKERVAADAPTPYILSYYLKPYGEHAKRYVEGYLEHLDWKAGEWQEDGSLYLASHLSKYPEKGHKDWLRTVQDVAAITSRDLAIDFSNTDMVADVETLCKGLNSGAAVEFGSPSTERVVTR